MIRPICLLLASALLAWAPAHAGPTQAGAVDLARAGPVEPGAPVMVDARIHTGPDGRLRSTLRDGAQVTLGAEAAMVVRAFDYDPEAPGGALGLDVGAGAFLFVGGRIEAASGGRVEIHTPVGRLDVRGIAVWGGMIDGAYGVLVVNGDVVVTTAGGSITLAAGEATTIARPEQAPVAEIWPNDKIDRAIQTVTLDGDENRPNLQ